MKQRILPYILMGILLIVFTLPLASAADWDNVKDYDEETRTITIENALGLGDKITEIR